MTRLGILGRAVVAAVFACGGAGAAVAQDWRATDSAGGSPGRRSGAAVGVEFFADERELVLDKYKESGLLAPTPPPPGYTTWDEEVLEHRIQYSARHYALRAHVQYLNDGPTASRVGIWLGPVWAEIGEHIFSGDYVYGAPPRGRNAIESKTGFGGGIFADVRGSLPGGPIFWSLGLDGTVAQVALDNGTLFGMPLDGEYTFAIGTVQARLGFAPKGQGVSPFVGAAFTYYYGDADLELIAGSTFYSADATFSERAFIRILAGLELGKGNDWYGRLQIGIWKPDEDTMVNLVAILRV